MLNRLQGQQKLLYLLLAPALIVLFYNLLIASPMYISESSFAIRSQSQGGTEGIASALFSLPSSSNNNSYILTEYASTIDIVRNIAKKLPLLNHYSSKDYDSYRRLSDNATDNDILEYWQKQVQVNYDPDTSIISISARAFTPGMAQKLNQEVLNESEILINKMNDRLQRDGLELANHEVMATEDELKEIRQKMFAYRNQNKVVSPETEINIYGSIRGSLEAELSKAKTELKESSSYLQNSSLQIAQLKSKIKSITAQLAEEKNRLEQNHENESSLNTKIEEFATLQLLDEFARTRYIKALESVELAKISAQAQSSYIVPFRQPSLPDESLFPKPFESALLTLIFTLIIVAILRMSYSIIMEHAGK